VVHLGWTTQDLEISKRFYMDVGWKPAFEKKETVFFQTGGMVFALFCGATSLKIFRRFRQDSDEQASPWLTRFARKAK